MEESYIYQEWWHVFIYFGFVYLSWDCFHFNPASDPLAHGINLENTNHVNSRDNIHSSIIKVHIITSKRIYNILQLIDTITQIKV